MTFKLADVENEAQLVEIGERLSEVLSNEQQLPAQPLDLAPEYVDAAKTVLATLSSQIAPVPSETVPLTEQQIETFLDFDPDFIEVAKNMLRDFIDKTEGMRGN